MTVVKAKATRAKKKFSGVCITYTLHSGLFLVDTHSPHLFRDLKLDDLEKKGGSAGDLVLSGRQF